MTDILRHAWLVLQRDLTVERRAREVLGVIAPLAAIAVFIVPLAVDRLEVRLSDVGPPVFWLVSYLFGMQVALRSGAAGTASRRRHLALAGVDPLSRLLGRSASAAVLLGVTVAVTAPLTVLLYDIAVPDLWRMVVPLLLYVLALAMVSTVAGEVTAGLAGRSVLAPLLVAPLSAPLLVGGNAAWISVVRGESTLTPVLVLVVATLAALATMTLGARSLEEVTT